MTTIYYVHVNAAGNPAGPRAKFHGSAKYGYNQLTDALKSCPIGCCVAERYTDGMNDWGGEVIAERHLGGMVRFDQD